MAKKGKFQTPRTSSAQQHVNKSAGKKKKKTKKKGAAGVTSVVVLAVLILALVGAAAWAVASGWLSTGVGAAFGVTFLAAVSRYSE